MTKKTRKTKRKKKESEWPGIILALVLGALICGTIGYGVKDVVDYGTKTKWEIRARGICIAANDMAGGHGLDCDHLDKYDPQFKGLVELGK